MKQWHPVFFEVQTTVPVGDRPREADFVLLRRTVEGVPPVTRTVPAWLAYSIGWLMETTYTMLRRRNEPPMTRFVVRELTTAHWFDLTAARRDLGYDARVSIKDGLRRLGPTLQ